MTDDDPRIAQLEALRPALGDTAVDAAIAALQSEAGTSQPARSALGIHATDHSQITNASQTIAASLDPETVW